MVSIVLAVLLIIVALVLPKFFPKSTVFMETDENGENLPVVKQSPVWKVARYFQPVMFLLAVFLLFSTSYVIIGADKIGQHRANSEEEGVDARRTTDITPQEQAAADDIQCAEQRNERDVLVQRMQHSGQSMRLQDEVDRHWQAAGERDDGAVAVIFPPVLGDQRQNGNAQQQEDKRQDAPDGQVMTEGTATGLGERGTESNRHRGEQ